MNFDLEDIKTINTIPGIYLITNKVNNKHYVGQSINLRHRLSVHYYNYIHRKYDNPLYRAFNKYGLSEFEVTILEADCSFTRENLDELEIHYISVYNSYGKEGYNQTLGVVYQVIK